MTIYCYRLQNGKVIERDFPMGNAPQRIDLEGLGVAIRDYRAEMPSIPSSIGWPMECLASGVNAVDAEELRRRLAESGVPTEVTRDGNPVYLDAQHRKRALKARGLFDRSAYY